MTTYLWLPSHFKTLRGLRIVFADPCRPSYQVRQFALKSDFPSLKRRPTWGLRHIVLLGACTLSAAAIGFYSTSTPLGCLLFTKFGIISDEATLQQYNPTGHDAQMIERKIDTHPLAADLRRNIAFIESRPHLKIPPFARQKNLTAGTLLGPGRIVVPPATWIEEGKHLVSITFLGTDLCGHPGIIHGGVLATLLDESMARCCWGAFPRKIAVTGKLEINYRKPVYAGSYIVLRAETVRIDGRKAWVRGTISTLVDPGEEPILLAEASGIFISPRPTTILGNVI